MKFNKTMFDQLKESLKKKNVNTNTLILRPVNNYLVRLLPSIKDIDKSIVHFYYHRFKSHSTGERIIFTCPTTYGEKCPACNLRFKLWGTGGDLDRNMSRELARREKWLVNCYVIDDPLTPENNGKIKIIRYGKQLHKIIDSAINGDDSDEFGMAIFDLSDKGCNFKIKVEKNTDGKSTDAWPTYVGSKFMNRSFIEGVSDNENLMNSIYDSVYDLSNEIPYNDKKIEDIIKEHFVCENQPINSNFEFPPKTEEEHPTIEKIEKNIKPEKVVDEIKSDNANNSDRDDDDKDENDSSLIEKELDELLEGIDSEDDNN